MRECECVRVCKCVRLRQAAAGEGAGAPRARVGGSVSRGRPRVRSAELPRSLPAGAWPLAAAPCLGRCGRCPAEACVKGVTHPPSKVGSVCVLGTDPSCRVVAVLGLRLPRELKDSEVPFIAFTPPTAPRNDGSAGSAEAVRQGGSGWPRAPASPSAEERGRMIFLALAQVAVAVQSRCPEGKAGIPGEVAVCPYGYGEASLVM